MELLLRIIKYLGDKSALNLAATKRNMNAQLRNEIYKRDMQHEAWLMIYSCWHGRRDILELGLKFKPQFRARLAQPVLTRELTQFSQDTRCWMGHSDTTFLLHIACWCGHSNVAALLLDHGADVHAECLPMHQTALYYSTSVDCVSNLYPSP